ncbi:GntR family transcriptional regulator [Brevibacterium spongiae]|uniref:GntR family transcriptional regulator n=1 Tax=Brevibacterium spongiae TaxID=2909672 RepID=A0ABY5SMD8_9MICO|nr:GntR family transcriptional regulator [Brevibacterium spongiae]UVI35683.1 GntR family transcriptional regulator [Brevibacterium spongiae]
MTHDPARSAAIAAELRARIIGGQLPPGARIRQEEIAAEFGVSRIPIREALRSLADSGLITLIPSTGAWVTELSLDECREVYLMRERLEPLLLSMAMPDHTPEAMAEFLHLAEAVEAASSAGEFLECDRAFHRAIMAVPHATRLTETVDHLWNLSHYYRRRLLTMEAGGRKDDIFAEHRMVLRAIEIGDAESAETTLAAHIRHTRRRVEADPQLFERG